MCTIHWNKKAILFILTVLMMEVFVFLSFTCAQTSTPAPRETLTRSIESQARQDVKNKRQRATASDLKILFGERATAMGVAMHEVQGIYDKAYSLATSEKPWWERIQPTTGWIVAVILAVLLAFHDVFKNYFTQFITWLVEGAYSQLAGCRPFWMISLKRYRKALMKEYRKFPNPFRPDGALQMDDIYVPLRVSGSSERVLVDAQTLLRKHRRLMVVGTPGSGKTMLMRHIAFTYAREGLRNFNGHPVPVLLELHRLNDPRVSLSDHLTAAMDRFNFPKAQTFVKSGLKRGFLMLLFDGLDEVNLKARERVVRQIKDLLPFGSDCRVVVTCRSAVYNDEFAGWAGQRAEIAEFDDRQVHSFLVGWASEMPKGKSVEHLLHELRERPRVMGLARNPLLLTIIAYLYCDPLFTLPHSRPEFYKQSTAVLLVQLDRMKQQPNRYKAPHKQLVLQALALYCQEQAGSKRQDRRSVALTDILVEIRKVLPSLNLEATHAEPLLDEIVGRSGLLKALDRGTRYPFSHLTLQEFFAALALEARPDELITRFNSDRDTWRETVKLWCGLAHDSTDLIKAIAAADPVTALECLGDTQQVDSDYASELIQLFLGRLGKTDSDQEAAAYALALVASDPHQRGKSVFNELVAIQENPAADSGVRIAAAQVLSLTNLPRAADVLAGYAFHDPALRSSLVRMGNLAVPALSKWAAKGEAWAFDALYTIGTSQAAVALVPMLWSAEQNSSYLAAWRLASLLADSQVEAVLNEFTISPEQRRVDYMDWVWAPFENDAGASLRIVGGRIALLLHTAPENTIPQDELSLTVDPRLILPLCAVAAQDNKLKLPDMLDLQLHTEKLMNLGRILPKKIEQQHFSSVVNELSDDPVWRYLFHCLAPAKQFELSRKLLQPDPIPTPDDWRNIFRPFSYTFDKSPQSKGLWLGGVVWFVWIVSFLTWGVHLERRAKNPLQGLLDMDSGAEDANRGMESGLFALWKGKR